MVNSFVILIEFQLNVAACQKGLYKVNLVTCFSSKLNISSPVRLRTWVSEAKVKYIINRSCFLLLLLLLVLLRR